VFILFSVINMNSETCSSARYCGVPNFTSPYRKTCFQPPFATPCSENNVNCMNTYSSLGGCYFDAECASNQCHNGQCLRPSSFTSNNAKIMTQISNADYQKVLESSGVQPGNMVCKGPLLVANYKGKKEVLCPIQVEPRISRNCKQALKLVWQCDQYKNKDVPMYNYCSDLNDCFVYDATFPDGQTQAVSVKNNDKCMRAANAALQQAAVSCASCQLPQCL